MNAEKIEKNPVIKLAFEFALETITFCEQLNAQRRFVVSNQLLKSATSIGANIIEAQNAESLADFIHKFKIAAKEAEESEYWLLLCKYSNVQPFEEQLLKKAASLSNLVGKIISTSKRRLNKTNC